ncbi:MAG TPA: (5-formylfuran-3-yl)methyl phosphate synthase, partial [Gemmatimonadales bacterium]|nr:(5-formylfuran-3-yl)methyl phosphate synthase [Gemmatimonadales bacterium]
LRGRPGAFAKLGFRGVADPRRAESILAAAVDAAERTDPGLAIVAVAYADARRAGSPPLETAPTIAVRARAAGILLDTALKDRGSIFDLCSPSRIAALVKEAHWAGLFVALAGSLDERDLDRAAALGVDIVGVRGAACEGGRAGRVSEARVRRLAERLRLATGPGPVHAAPTPLIPQF